MAEKELPQNKNPIGGSVPYDNGGYSPDQRPPPSGDYYGGDGGFIPDPRPPKGDYYGGDAGFIPYTPDRLPPNVNTLHPNDGGSIPYTAELPLAVFVFLGLFVFTVVCVVAYKFSRASERNAPERKEKAAAKALQAWEASLVDADPKLPREAFQEQLARDYYDGAGDIVLKSAYLTQLITTIGEIYEKEFIPPKIPKGVDPRGATTLVFDAFLKGMLDLTDHAPDALLQRKGEETSPLDFYVEHTQPFGEDGAALRALAQPFKDSHWKELFPNYRDWQYGIPGPTRNFEDEDDPRRRREMERDYREKLKEWEKYEADSLKNTPPGQLQLSFTPYYDYYQALVTCTTQTPFIFEERFAHQFVVGATNSGKTTFLSAQMNQDFDTVARGEACVFVMDSQHKWLESISKLARFAPGGDLHGKLIYLEAHPDYPLALNFFALNQERMAQLGSRDRDTLKRAATESAMFFIQSLLKMPLTPHMETVLGIAFRAMQLIPGATVRTLDDLLRPEGFGKHAEHLASLDDYDRRFLSKDIFQPEYSNTLPAIKTRLAGFAGDDFFKKIFFQPHNKFDLYEQLQTPKVIVINTIKGYLKGATEPFGRYFISKLLQATEERMLIPKSARFPVYAYIDEAADYIKHEQNIAELFFKARKQNISLTIAIQAPIHVSETVLAALEQAWTQSRPLEKPLWAVSFNKKDPVPVIVPPTDFETMPHMSETHYGEMLAYMRKTFCADAPTPPTTPPSTLPPPTMPTPPLAEAEMDTGRV